MTVETIGIPQADVLWDVARVAEAVARGRDSYETIGAAIGAKSQRQGLYYTQAARILGLVAEEGDSGRVALTPYGRAFVGYDRNSQRQALRRLLREREPTRSVIVALREGDGLSHDEIAAVLQQLAPLADSTARRRAHTAAAWLVAVGLAGWREGRLRYLGSASPPGAWLRS